MVLEIITGSVIGILCVRCFKKLVRAFNRKVAAIDAENAPEKQLQRLQEELGKLRKEIEEIEKMEAQKKEKEPAEAGIS